MKTCRLAILGVTGAVGQEMLSILSEKKWPSNNLRIFASAKSAGKKFPFRETELVVEQLTPDSFNEIEVVLSALDNDVAQRFIPIAVEKGCLVIDNSSLYRLNQQVPLVIPEINPEDIASQNGVIANPNCSTIIALMAIAPLHACYPIQSMIVSTYQAVSGAGIKGMEELTTQTHDLQMNKIPQPAIFPRQIAYNLIPQIGFFDEEGNTSEELKLQNESRKILHHQDLQVICTCVRVPVIRSHSESITLFFEQDLDVSQVKEILSHAKGVKVVDDPLNYEYPTPLDTSNQDLIYVGRIRKQTVGNQTAISFWCCGDQLRKGAATNSIQILESYLKDYA